MARLFSASVTIGKVIPSLTLKPSVYRENPLDCSSVHGLLVIRADCRKIKGGYMTRILVYCRVLPLACFFVALAWDVSSAADYAYRFEKVDIKVHVSFSGEQRDDIVRLTDLDNKGQLIGNDFADEGFFVPKRKPTEIHCPGEQTGNGSAMVSAINNHGQIVGSCSAGGFIRDKRGDITILNFPGAEGTVALGINDFGHVVGQYWGDAFGQGLQRFHGFLWKDGIYTTVDAPFTEAMATVLSGINNAGQIIGTFLHHRPDSSDLNEYDSEVAFVYDNGNFTELNFPGSQIPFCCGAQTFPMDINNNGDIIGATYDSQGERQFFLMAAGQYFRITGLPESVADFVGGWGINDKNQIAGAFIQRFPCDSCGIEGEPGYTFELHSFVAKPTKKLKKDPIE